MFNYEEYWKNSDWKGSPFDHPNELLAAIQGEYIVELGCGNGRIAELFKDRHYTGVDIRSDKIEEAKKKYPDLKFICQDLNKLDLIYPFDTVFTVVTLQHVVPEKIEALAEKMKGWATKIVMIESTSPNTLAPYCFNHDYEKLFNVTNKINLNQYTSLYETNTN